MDKDLKCQDCGDMFVFTEREKEFYQEKQFSEPKRCSKCREKKKASYQKKENRRY